jgi:hypothetical protein
MEQKQTRRAKPMTESAKKPYQQPQLQVYGDLRQITQNMGNKTTHDNPAKSGTHLGNS